MAKCNLVESLGKGIFRLEFEISSRVISFVVRLGVDTPETVIEEFKNCFYDIYQRKAESVDINWVGTLKQFFPKQVGRFISYATP